MKIKDLILKTEKINWQDLADLQPINLKNNYHSEKTKQSIIQNGFARAIYVWQDGDKIYIVDGHLRSDILRELKSEGFEIPDKLNCTFLDLPNKKTAVKYLLQVFNQKTNPINEQSLNSWIDDLEISLDDIEVKIDDLHIDITEDIDIEELEPEEIKEDEVPEVKHTFVVKGDLFELIDEEQGLTHRVLCGDSTMIDDVDKVMNGEKADMVFTDPPYNTGMTAKTQAGGNANTLRKGKGSKKGNGSARLSHMFNDSFTDEEWGKLLIDFTNNYYLSSKEDSVSYICLDWRRSHELVPNAKNAGFKFSNLIIWDKVVHGLGSDYKYTHEFIHVFKKGNPALNTNQGEQDYQDIWHIQRKIGRDEEHATKKPIELCTRAIKHASKQKDLVIDFFLGSGSTLIACQQTKRNCYGIELDERYTAVCVLRWRNYMEKEGKKYSIKRNGDIYKLD
jgi:DNA modification methylase